MAKYRTGRDVPFTIYKQRGPAPTKKDVFVGSGRSEREVAEIVRLANIGLEVQKMAQKEPK